MRTVAIVSFASLSIACGPSTSRDEGARWREAERSWRDREPGAYDAWIAIDGSTPSGAAAHRRIREADVHYRHGIELLRDGEDGAGDALREGVAIAPMDPALYLPLARACRDADLEPRAAEYYLKFLAARPDDANAPVARRELAQLDPELAGIFEPAAAPPPRESAEPGPSQWATAAVAAVLGAALTGLTGLVVVAFRRRGVSLAKLAAEAPELHPAIAYLVSSLRHELLKHRIGAVRDAVAALERGGASAEQLAFLRTRLYGGEPLGVAWRGHVAAFERALGYRLDLRRDRAFRRAARAVARIDALEPRIARSDRAAARPLADASNVLGELDRELALLVRGLVRTSIDSAFLSGVVDQVRAEYGPGRVALDELRVDAGEEHDAARDAAIEVEVFRVDLVLILKNIVRNAILAVGRTEPPRRVGVDARVELEPTGEEVVFIRVQDSSKEQLSTEDIYDRRFDRGLGLVTAALTRYDGAIEVERATEGFEKAVSVRLFCALGESGDDA